MVLLIALIIAFLTFFLVLSIIVYIRQSRSIDIFHRLRRHNINETKKETEDDDLLIKFYKFVKKVAKPIVDWNISQKIEFKVKQAGLSILGGEFIILLLLNSVLGGGLLYLLTLDKNIAILAAVVTPLLLWMSLLMKIKRRRNAFTEQLGDCLTTVSNALRAGYSFQQAMGVIANEMEPPISDEFTHVTADMSMGITLEEALEDMNKRVNSSDFELVVTAVLIQREVGGNLAQILDNISDTISERIRMKREILTLTAQGRLSAVVLVALPFVAAAIMYFLNRNQFMLLIEEPMGRIAIAVAIVMEILGYIVIKRIVDIDV